MSLVLDTAVGL